MIFCFTWGNPDPINILILIVYAVMAVFMYLTFANGQKQTAQSLAINQFNIFQKELESFILEAKQIKFKKPSKVSYVATIEDPFEKEDGIDYISLFSNVPEINRTELVNSEENKKIVNHFRFNILFPLARYYYKLNRFLLRIKKDNVLSSDYKDMLYNYIERDLLQNYLRICNNKFPTDLYYDLSIFETIAYSNSEFYSVNRFYIENNAFQHETLDFYVKHN